MNKILMPALIACSFISSTAFAADEKITITAPEDGSTISSSGKFKLSYEADPGPEGDHLHLNVDGKRIEVLRKLKGSTEIDALAPGKHEICLLVNTKAHVPVGIEKCINVTAQ